jgi:hypothetical protein
MNRFKTNQKLLFKAETVFNLRPLEKYEIFFSFLDISPLEILYPSTGRPPIPYKVLLKALICKNIKNISYLSDLRVSGRFFDTTLILAVIPRRLIPNILAIFLMERLYLFFIFNIKLFL